MDATQHNTLLELYSLLRFYQSAGVNICIQENALDYFASQDSAQMISATQSSLPAPSPRAFLEKEDTNLSQKNLQHTEELEHKYQAKDRDLSSRANKTSSLLSRTSSSEQTRTLLQKTTSLEALQTLLEAYEECALKQTAKTTCFADGTPHSPLMLLGEAPGREEDIAGLPFVGAAGKLLNHMLDAIDLKRDQVYIANVVPWRPPGNRLPTPAEVELCRPFIVRQIELAKPKILLALGSLATQFLTGEKGIMKLRGKWLSCNITNSTTIAVMPTLHPAYLLRNPLHKKFVWQDFLHVKKRLQELSSI